MKSVAQLPLDLAHRVAMGRADFLVAPGNAAAVAWLDRWPDWPAPALAIAGPAGSGKTHLGSVWRTRSHAATTSGDRLAGADLPALLHPVPAVVVDDADAVAGERAAEEALLHLYNLAREAGGHLLLLAARPPAHWPVALPDLASRLRAAPVAEVGPPDDELLGAVLVKLFADRQLQPAPEVIGYLTVHMERSLAAAQQVVEATDRAALAARRPVTVPLVRGVLADLARDGQAGEE